jgi:hypothetical protein
MGPTDTIYCVSYPPYKINMTTKCLQFVFIFVSYAKLLAFIATMKHILFTVTYSVYTKPDDDPCVASKHIA